MYIITIKDTSLQYAWGLPVGRLLLLFLADFHTVHSGNQLSCLGYLGTQLVLPASMPFYSDWRAYAGLIVLIVFMSLAGGLLSIHGFWKLTLSQQSEVSDISHRTKGLQRIWPRGISPTWNQLISAWKRAVYVLGRQARVKQPFVLTGPLTNSLKRSRFYHGKDTSQLKEKEQALPCV